MPQRQGKHERPQERPEVVIVGAGFGGLAVTEHLAHLPVAITLVDRHDYHTFHPLLYQVATSLLNAEDVGRPVRDMFHHQENVTFRQATATGADWEVRHLQLEPVMNSTSESGRMEYEYHTPSLPLRCH